MQPEYIAPPIPARDRLRHQARILSVLARTDFKFKYAGSALGYLWSLAKPLIYFAVLLTVFQSVFKTRLPHYPLYLILGIVLWMFVVEGVSAALPSIVVRGTILRRIRFPPIVIPVSATLTALMSFAINAVVAAIFVLASDVTPGLDWILLIPLLAELYVFVLVVGLIASTLYVRYRDVGQVWEVAAGALFFAAPIVYPITVLPMWARHILAFYPFVQILQDVRVIVLGPQALTVQLLGHHGNHLAPLFTLVVLAVIASVLYRRDSPKFAELA